MYVSEICAEGIFVTFPWWLKNVKSRSKIALFSNESHFEIWFPKKRTIMFFWSKLSKLHKKDPILHVATTFSLKQGETRTSHGPIPHPFNKGCGMGPWLVLVSLCFRENVVATCKIGSFLCSLDNLLQKNVIVFFFGNQISKWCSFEKRAIFDILFTFFSHQGKFQKFLQHISHSHTYTYFAHLIDVFCLTNFEKDTNLSGTVSLWYESWCWFLFAPFWNNQ